MATLHVKDFDPDLHRAARMEALRADESLKAFVTEAVRREIERRRHARGDDAVQDA